MSCCMKGTKYFQGQIVSVLTSCEGDLARGSGLWEVLTDFRRKNRAPTSTENSYVLSTRSTGLRILVTTDVRLGILFRILISSCEDKCLQLGWLHPQPLTLHVSQLKPQMSSRLRKECKDSTRIAISSLMHRILLDVSEKTESKMKT